MLTATRRWRDVSDHRCFAVASERVFQYLSELAASEGGMFLVQVEGPDAFFQSKQRFVDLSTFTSGLLVVVDRVRTSLASC